MKNSKISLIEIKRYLKKKGLDIIKKKNNSKKNDWSPLSRTIVSSLFIITFFYVVPVIVEYKEERANFSKDFKNNSKTYIYDNVSAEAITDVFFNEDDISFGKFVNAYCKGNRVTVKD